MKGILFVQQGDFAEAYDRFAAGGPETYRDQKRSVDFVAALAPGARVTTAAPGPSVFRRALATNLYGVGIARAPTKAEIRALFDAAEATHLVLRYPDIDVLREARRRRVHVLPSFADVFSRGGARRAYANVRLRRALRRSQAVCLSNHSLNASRSAVEALGFSRDHVVPWDWSAVPSGGPPKTGVADPDRPRVFFAGAMSEAKGVGDCLEAAARLATSGCDVAMTFAGGGDLSVWRARADALGISDRVSFVGMVSNAEVRRQMRDHDMIVVPSRHTYAEGLPNTIYEGLASGSPVILSDHPAFAGRLAPGTEALFFPAGDAGALADRVRTLACDTTLYGRLSANSAAAHDALYVGMEWTRSVSAFLDDPEDRTGWVAAHSLAALETDGGG